MPSIIYTSDSDDSRVGDGDGGDDEHHHCQNHHQHHHKHHLHTPSYEVLLYIDYIVDPILHHFISIIAKENAHIEIITYNSTITCLSDRGDATNTGDDDDRGRSSSDGSGGDSIRFFKQTKQV